LTKKIWNLKSFCFVFTLNNYFCTNKKKWKAVKWCNLKKKLKPLSLMAIFSFNFFHSRKFC
jgi:hypothetical protein